MSGEVILESASDGEEAKGEEESIKVVIRMRPLNSKESVSKPIWKVLNRTNTITQTTLDGKPLDLDDRAEGRNIFAFDKVFDRRSTTRDVYVGAVQNIVKSVLGGVNGTVLAYGQTSSGKTYTFFGRDGGTNPESFGIVQMAANDMFQQAQADTTRSYKFKASFIEVYNEEVRDLLVCGIDGTAETLHVRQNPKLGFCVNAQEEIVSTLPQLMKTLDAGNNNRAVADTAMNERSSRSHTIFRITVETKKKKQYTKSNDKGLSMTESKKDSSIDIEESDISSVEEDDGPVIVSTLNLVDLAGSESVRQTEADGTRKKEGGKINQSLLALSNVISALSSGSGNHINFRDSKLTKILQPSLSGNARMAMICCATPSHLYVEETRSTLMFAGRAKLIKTKAVVNEIVDDKTALKRTQRELEKTKEELAASRKELFDFKSGKAYASQNASLPLPSFLSNEHLSSSIAKARLLAPVSINDTNQKSKRRRSDAVPLGPATSINGHLDYTPSQDKKRKMSQSCRKGRTGRDSHSYATVRKKMFQSDLENDKENQTSQRRDPCKTFAAAATDENIRDSKIIADLRKDNEKFRKKLYTSESECSNLLKERNALLQENEHLKSRNSALVEEQVAAADSADSKEVVQSINNTKDSACGTCRNLKEEVDILQQKLSQEVAKTNAYRSELEQHSPVEENLIQKLANNQEDLNTHFIKLST